MAYSVQQTQGNGIAKHPKATDVRVEEGHLLLTDDDRDVVAAYAPNTWRHVIRTSEADKA